jgi:hypothetical protein
MTVLTKASNNLTYRPTKLAISYAAVTCLVYRELSNYQHSATIACILTDITKSALEEDLLSASSNSKKTKPTQKIIFRQ